MSSFSVHALQDKFSRLTMSQDSIETLSLWIIHHKAYAKTSVGLWLEGVEQGDADQRLVLFYLANDVLQNGRRKGVTVFKDLFREPIRKSVELIRGLKIQTSVERMLRIWRERQVYESSFLKELETSIEPEKKKAVPVEKQEVPKKDVPAIINPFKVSLLEDALTEMMKFEGEMKVKQSHLTSLRIDVSNTSSLSQLKDKSSGGQFSADFEEANHRLHDYQQCLAIEVAERAKILEMLAECKIRQEQKLTEFKELMKGYKDLAVVIRSLQEKLTQRTRELERAMSTSTSDPTAKEDITVEGDMEIDSDNEASASTQQQQQLQLLQLQKESSGRNSSKSQPHNTGAGNNKSSNTTSLPSLPLPSLHPPLPSSGSHHRHHHHHHHHHLPEQAAATVAAAPAATAGVHVGSGGGSSNRGLPSHAHAHAHQQQQHHQAALLQTPPSPSSSLSSTQQQQQIQQQQQQKLRNPSQNSNNSLAASAPSGGIIFMPPSNSFPPQQATDVQNNLPGGGTGRTHPPSAALTSFNPLENVMQRQHGPPMGPSHLNSVPFPGRISLQGRPGVQPLHPQLLGNGGGGGGGVAMPTQPPPLPQLMSISGPRPTPGGFGMESGSLLRGGLPPPPPLGMGGALPGPTASALHSNFPPFQALGAGAGRANPHMLNAIGEGQFPSNVSGSLSGGVLGLGQTQLQSSLLPSLPPHLLSVSASQQQQQQQQNNIVRPAVNQNSVVAAACAAASSGLPSLMSITSNASIGGGIGVVSSSATAATTMHEPASSASSSEPKTSLLDDRLKDLIQKKTFSMSLLSDYSDSSDDENNTDKPYSPSAAELVINSPVEEAEGSNSSVATPTMTPDLNAPEIDTPKMINPSNPILHALYNKSSSSSPPPHPLPLPMTSMTSMTGSERVDNGGKSDGASSSVLADVDKGLLQSILNNVNVNSPTISLATSPFNFAANNGSSDSNSLAGSGVGVDGGGGAANVMVGSLLPNTVASAMSTSSGAVPVVVVRDAAVLDKAPGSSKNTTTTPVKLLTSQNLTPSSSSSPVTAPAASLLRPAEPKMSIDSKNIKITPSLTTLLDKIFPQLSKSLEKKQGTVGGGEVRVAGAAANNSNSPPPMSGGPPTSSTAEESCPPPPKVRRTGSPPPPPPPSSSSFSSTPPPPLCGANAPDTSGGGGGGGGGGIMSRMKSFDHQHGSNTVAVPNHPTGMEMEPRPLMQQQQDRPHNVPGNPGSMSELHRDMVGEIPPGPPQNLMRPPVSAPPSLWGADKMNAPFPPSSPMRFRPPRPENFPPPRSLANSFQHMQPKGFSPPGPPWRQDFNNRGPRFPSPHHHHHPGFPGPHGPPPHFHDPHFRSRPLRPRFA